MMKDEWFLPVGVLGAVITRLLDSPGFAEMVWHLAAGDAWRLWG